jgi:hypothetical protein
MIAVKLLEEHTDILQRPIRIHDAHVKGKIQIAKNLIFIPRTML